MTDTVQQYWASSEKWATINPILKNNEVGYETDTNKIKIGNGINLYLDLPTKLLKMDPL